ncbi:hypothetical protein LXL04_008783 [Taraxacum kok-saghyz]
MTGGFRRSMGVEDFYIFLIVTRTTRGAGGGGSFLSIILPENTYLEVNSGQNSQIAITVGSKSLERTILRIAIRGREEEDDAMRLEEEDDAIGGSTIGGWFNAINSFGLYLKEMRLEEERKKMVRCEEEDAIG